MTIPRTRTDDLAAFRPFDARSDAIFRVLAQRFVTHGGAKVAEAISNGTTSKAITFTMAEPDTAYGVIATPTYDTKVWVTSQATTGFTLNFADPGTTGKVIHWVTYR